VQVSLLKNKICKGNYVPFIGKISKKCFFLWYFPYLLTL